MRCSHFEIKYRYDVVVCWYRRLASVVSCPYLQSAYFDIPISSQGAPTANTLAAQQVTVIEPMTTKVVQKLSKSGGENC